MKMSTDVWFYSQPKFYWTRPEYQRPPFTEGNHTKKVDQLGDQTFFFLPVPCLIKRTTHGSPPKKKKTKNNHK